MFQHIRHFSELVHSPNGGFYLYNAGLNHMFTHVPLTHTPRWCDATAAGVTVCSSADMPPHAVHSSYFNAEHQAGFVAGVGGYGVGMVNGQ